MSPRAEASSTQTSMLSPRRVIFPCLYGGEERTHASVFETPGAMPPIPESGPQSRRLGKARTSSSPTNNFPATIEESPTSVVPLFPALLPPMKGPSLGAPSAGSRESSFPPVPSIPLRQAKNTQPCEEAPPKCPSLVKSKPSGSILRRSRSTPSAPRGIVKTGSVESDMPSLASSVDSGTESGPTRRSSEPILNRSISFDPKVLVREFERCKSESGSTWYSPSELVHFKRQAVQRILAHSAVIPTGTGRAVIQQRKHLLFSHQALAPEADNDFEGESVQVPPAVQNVLIVDSHEVCRKLFAKSFQWRLPHAKVVAAASFAEAASALKHQSFEIVLVEERLQGGCSGADLLCDASSNKTVLIGVSAKLEEDKERLEKCADVVWSKPPPRLDGMLMDDLVRKLQAKQGS